MPKLRSIRRPGFTLVEMLVVVAIIGILVSVVLVVGQGSVESARIKDTRVLLTQLDGAIDAFQSANPYRTIKTVQRRFGESPPDDMMSFTEEPEHGLNTDDMGIPNLMPGGQGTFTRQSGANVSDDLNSADYLPLGDIKALCWALQQTSESRTLFESIPDRFRQVAPTQGQDAEFFDLNDNGRFDALVDKEVYFLVDGWGQPLSYYNVREFGPHRSSTGGFGQDESPTSHGWVAREMLRINGNQPVVASYGTDGEAQIAAGATLEGQYIDRVLQGSGPASGPVFDSIYQNDNLYNVEALNDRLQSIEVP